MRAVLYRGRFFRDLPYLYKRVAMRFSPCYTKVMIVTPVKTRILAPPKDDLLGAIRHSVRSLPEKSVFVVTSKVVSIWQGRCVPMREVPDKEKLIAREADWYIPRERTPGAWVTHTIKNNLFIPSGGVDESNADGHYILWPKNPKRVARELWAWLRKTYRVKNLGVIISDSHTVPLRRGVLGISLAHYGFVPLKDYRGMRDIFGRTLKMTQMNIADGLAVAAVLLMGEGKERTPLALIRDVPWVRFMPREWKPRGKFSSFEIKTKEDVYYPLFASVKWRKGGAGRGYK